jgi:hypothetical protein
MPAETYTFPVNAQHGSALIWTAPVVAYTTHHSWVAPVNTPIVAHQGRPPESLTGTAGDISFLGSQGLHYV